MYMEDNLELNQNELIDILIAVFYEYIADKELEINIDKEAIEYLFENEHNLDTNDENSYIFMKIKEPEDIIQSDNEIMEFLNSIKKLTPNKLPKAVIKESFEKLIEDVKNSKQEQSQNLKRYNHIRAIAFVYDYINIVQELDFTTIDNSITKLVNRLRLFDYYYQQMKNISSRYSQEDYFKQIFVNYQTDYLKAKEYFDKHIKMPTQLHDRAKLGRYQELIESVYIKYKKEFGELMKQFLKQYEKKVSLVCGHLTYEIFNIVDTRAKKSKKIREFYVQNGFKGDFSPKSFIPYYIKKNNPNNTKKTALNIAEKYLSTLNKKDIIIVSDNTPQILKIKQLIERVNKIWNVYGYNNINLIDGYFAKHTPDILLIDFEFKVTKDENLISKLQVRYPKLKSNTKVVALFDKLGSDVIQRDILDNNYSYFKKPINFNELEKFFIFV